jgi:predicted ATPase
MRSLDILEIRIANYKSLKSVQFIPSDLTIVVGANASGKSNFADSLDFLSEIYRHGLELAIDKKGGYENIVYRSRHASGEGISFRIEYKASSHFTSKGKGALKVSHEFILQSKAISKESDYSILSEKLKICEVSEAVERPIGGFKRDLNSIVPYEIEIQSDKSRESIDHGFILMKYGLQRVNDIAANNKLVSSTELIFSGSGLATPFFSQIMSPLSSIKVYQINPHVSREFSSPSPQPQLTKLGSNLPSVVNLLQKDHKSTWTKIIHAMRSIIPTLEEIEVEYTTSRSLGLFFKEKRTNRPWIPSELSDGTIQALALLVAVYDPRSTFLVIEEIENSFHPWIIRLILDACKESSKTKHIVITTHSPTVINYVHPSDVFVMWKSKGGSSMNQLIVLDPHTLTMWESGTISTFDVLDSGSIRNAVPNLASEDE